MAVRRVPHLGAGRARVLASSRLRAPARRLRQPRGARAVTAARGEREGRSQRGE
jgi:hypothetical protein